MTLPSPCHIHPQRIQGSMFLGSAMGREYIHVCDRESDLVGPWLQGRGEMGSARTSDFPKGFSYSGLGPHVVLTAGWCLRDPAVRVPVYAYISRCPILHIWHLKRHSRIT